jgi:hypothetical protein
MKKALFLILTMSMLCGCVSDGVGFAIHSIGGLMADHIGDPPEKNNKEKKPNQ